MKKILIIAMILAFMAGCSGPPEQSQKESTKKPVKAAKQYDPWPKNETSKAVPMKEWPGGKNREQSEKDLKEGQQKLNELIGETKGIKE